MNRIASLILAVSMMTAPTLSAAEECELLSASTYETISAAQIESCLGDDTENDVNMRDGNGNTPLHLAAMTSPDTEIIRALLRLGADPAIRNAEGWTAMHSLAAAGRISGHVAILKNAGAEMNAELPDGTCRVRNCGTIPLHLLAARADVPELLRAFLAAGADHAARDPQGRTALHHVAAQSGLEEYETLMAAGANIDINDFEGWSVLHLAAQRNSALEKSGPANRDLVAALLAMGADPDARNNGGQVPLMLAAAYSDDPMVWSALLAATDPENWCRSDDRDRTIKALFDLNEGLKRDEGYWELNQLCQ